MEKEFNLSEKIITGDLTSYDDSKSEYYDDLTIRVEDVKEFIHQETILIDELIRTNNWVVEFWDKRNKLIGKGLK